MLNVKVSDSLLLIAAEGCLYKTTDLNFASNQYYGNVDGAHLKRRESPFGNPNSYYRNRDAYANDGYGPSTGRGMRDHNLPGQGATRTNGGVLPKLTLNLPMHSGPNSLNNPK
ncbi:hypothetical protein VP01_338g4 [Puccinia sorghi]|uniref:Uncharacterized protein n=1 Tax=Puccinia sorghi TaxID=27349 RepID=A0A0L6UWQ0_9BASI|nr:hypothetical protein VP01_338g4 [Puccinia sorghi]